MIMLQATKKFAVFSGRSARAEYWYHILFLMILGGISSLISPILQLIVSLVLMIPSIAVAIRRLHDIGKSGWWYFIIFIPIVGAILFLLWTCRKGTEGENVYGSDPLADTDS